MFKVYVSQHKNSFGIGGFGRILEQVQTTYLTVFALVSKHYNRYKVAIQIFYYCWNYYRQFGLVFIQFVLEFSQSQLNLHEPVKNTDFSYARTNIYKFSFWLRYINKWNNLPENLVHCNSVSKFKKGLKSYLYNVTR